MSPKPKLPSREALVFFLLVVLAAMGVFALVMDVVLGADYEASALLVTIVGAIGGFIALDQNAKKKGDE